MASTRLADLRAELARRELDGFIIPRADEHLGEYVPPGAERLGWLTGFTGSAGLAVVLAHRAALFVDGRYVLQAAAQTDAAVWEQRHITEQPPAAWIAEAAPGGRIGYDPLLIAEESLQRFLDAGITMVATPTNPLDAVWTDRPAPPLDPARPHPISFAGRTSAQKRDEIAAILRAARQDAAVLTDPASIAWLLNIRGDDVPFTPFALGFALVRADASVALFMDPRKLPEETRTWLGNGVAVQSRAELPAALAAFAGKRVRVDPANSPVWFAQTLRAAGAEVAAALDPVLLPKACKNETEQDGVRTAHLRDATAVVRFLHWLTNAAGRETEMSAAAQLLAFRAALPEFRGESFSAIAGAGEHGAIMHYRVSAETDRPIRHDELFLIDSGAQFPEGTTDVTRTVWTGPGVPPDELRDRYTRVLKGHIAIATLRFPQGVGGAHIDSFARHALWQAGLDYDHGTGHGVGSYLSVHEGPVSLSRLAKPIPLAPGMLLSNEPGFYLPGRFGIRLENLVLVQPANLAGASKPFLAFETVTLAPFDRRMLERSLLTAGEIAWLDAYHARVLAEVGPAIDGLARDWLTSMCAPLANEATQKNSAGD
jgi:Xaa-Pro aminopeptidase